MDEGACFGPTEAQQQKSIIHSNRYKMVAKQGTKNTASGLQVGVGKMKLFQASWTSSMNRVRGPCIHPAELNDLPAFENVLAATPDGPVPLNFIFPFRRHA